MENDVINLNKSGLLDNPSLHFENLRFILHIKENFNVIFEYGIFWSDVDLTKITTVLSVS